MRKRTHFVTGIFLVPGDRTAQNRIRTVLGRGLQRDPGFEKHWPEVLGTLVETGKKGGGNDTYLSGRSPASCAPI